MIENFKIGDKVIYIGTVSKNYVGQEGLVISEPYVLPSVQNQSFVDVEWFLKASRQKKDIPVSKNCGHVVNVKNLEKL